MGALADHVVRAELPLSGAPVFASPHDDPMVERGLLLEAQQLARMGSWSADLRTGQVYLSEGLRKLCGLSASSTVDDALALVHEDDLAVLEEFRRQVRSNGSSRPVELEVRDNTGNRTVLVRARAERDAEGTVVRVHGTVQDVTKYRAVERQLIQDRRLFGDADRKSTRLNSSHER